MTMMPWLQNPNARKQPGLGQQLASKAADKIAAQQVAKLGLGAAGTAVAGPLGGAVGSAAGELAGPLAGQLVGSLFKKGGPVYMQGGGFPWASQMFQQAQGPQGGFSPEGWARFVQNLRNEAARRNQRLPEGQLTEQVPEDLKQEQAPKPEVIAPRAKSRAEWNIPLGEALGAEWSTSGHYADMDTGSDAYGAHIKGTWKFNTGGEVPEEKKSIWNQISDKVSGDFKKRKNLFGEGKKPVYKAIGGLTKGPLGMSDLLAAGKDKSISKVKMKKSKGDISDEVEYNYHPPLKPKGE